LAKQWLECSREKKRELRFERRLSPAGVKFSSPPANIKYRFKAARLMKKIKRQSPYCVPVTILTCTVCRSGINLKTAMYHPEELKIRGQKFIKN
jgi:hypothetical protein